jgi:Fe-S cluster biogenesis protein NfuA
MEKIIHPVEIYQEMTPNPESLKFVTDAHLLPNFQIDFRTKESVKGDSGLADKLFELEFVNGVFISQNFVTVTKTAEADWYEITPIVKDVIKKYLQADNMAVAPHIIKRGEPAAKNPDGTETDAETKIKELLDKYVRPAVEGDGGHIAFRSFTDGIVSLSMQGSCSGCPSSQITLKAGIEGLLKRMVPEVQEVVAVEE